MIRRKFSILFLQFFFVIFYVVFDFAGRIVSMRFLESRGAVEAPSLLLLQSIGIFLVATIALVVLSVYAHTLNMNTGALSVINIFAAGVGLPFNIYFFRLMHSYFTLEFFFSRHLFANELAYIVLKLELLIFASNLLINNREKIERLKKQKAVL